MNYLLGLLVAVATTSPIALEGPTSPVEPPSVETRHIIPFDLKLSSKAQIEDYIVSRATTLGYKPNVALAIAKAESGLDPNARNPGSTASGLFQFINGTFKWLCIDTYAITDTMDDKNDPHVQTECAIMAFKDGLESHWNESKPVWGESLTGN